MDSSDQSSDRLFSLHRRSSIHGLPRELTTSEPFEPQYWTAASNQSLISRRPPDRPEFFCSPVDL